MNLPQASAQNSESDNQKEEKLVMEKKIAELEDKLRVRLAEREGGQFVLTLLTPFLFQQFNISTLHSDQVSERPPIG